MFHEVWTMPVHDNSECLPMCDVQIESCKTCKTTVYTNEPVLITTTESVDAVYELGYTSPSTHTPCPPSDYWLCDLTLLLK